MSLPAFDEKPSEQPTGTPAPENRRRGLLLLADLFTAPKRAFATIAESGEWLPAALVVGLLGVGGSLLLAPAFEHLVTVYRAADPSATRLSPADLKAAAGYDVAAQVTQQTLGSLMYWIWTALVMAAVTRAGPRSFRTYFALAANVAVPAALGFFISSLFVALHDPSAYANVAQLNRAFPDNLGIFERHDNDEAVSFLANFDVFGLWSTLLLAFGVRAIGKIELIWALSASFALWLSYALYQLFANR